MTNAPDPLLALLEMRLSRLERIVAARIGVGEQPAEPASDRIVYRMDDPRLLLSGAYDVEGAGSRQCWRWFGRSESIQMIFPHGRGTAQRVRFLVRPFKTVDVGQARIVVDELPIASSLKEQPGGFFAWTFELPPAYGPQTEIDILGAPVGRPEDFGSSDQRTLSFSLYEATFTFLASGPHLPTLTEATDSSRDEPPSSPEKRPQVSATEPDG